jgi:hypothetical protein
LGKQLDVSGSVENVPAAQVVHTLSAAALPGVETYVPAPQVDQGAHCAAFRPALKLLAGQGAQMRPLVLVPPVVTNWPGVHTFQGVHAPTFAAVL